MAAIIVHGGAGKFKAGAEESARAGCRAAAEAGFALLQQGASALDAVERAVQVLEDDLSFNAGTGAHPNAEGFGYGRIVLVSDFISNDLL